MPQSHAGRFIGPDTGIVRTTVVKRFDHPMGVSFAIALFKAKYSYYAAHQLFL